MEENKTNSTDTAEENAPVAEETPVEATETATEEKPEKKKKQKGKHSFSFVEPIIGIFIAILFTTIFLWFSQIITIAFIGGELIPTFDAEVIKTSLWLPIIAWGVIRVGVNVAYLIERSYTKRLTVISIIGNALTAVASFLILFNDRIVYSGYVDFIRTYFEDTAAWFGEILTKPNLIILVVIIIVLIFDSIGVATKSRKVAQNKE
ncbi:MAG: hypothetical protein FWD44_03695 [Oscillospiraceae bacterium]|nr:hypothetical protein [Oscillospiraceae bacterium]